MFNKKEILFIIIASVFLAFAITLIETWNLFLYALVSVFIVIMVNAFAKKIAAYFFESEVEIKLWEFRRYGFRKAQKTKTPNY